MDLFNRSVGPNQLIDISIFMKLTGEINKFLTISYLLEIDA